MVFSPLTHLAIRDGSTARCRARPTRQPAGCVSLTPPPATGCPWAHWSCSAPSPSSESEVLERSQARQCRPGEACRRVSAYRAAEAAMITTLLIPETLFQEPAWLHHPQLSGVPLTRLSSLCSFNVRDLRGSTFSSKSNNEVTAVLTSCYFLWLNHRQFH